MKRLMLCPWTLPLLLAAVACSAPPAGSQAGAAGGPPAASPPAAEATPAGSPKADGPSLERARQLAEQPGGAADAEPSDAGDRRLLEDIRGDIAGLDFDGDPRGEEHPGGMAGENPLLTEENPLLTRRVRERWLASAIHNVGYEKAAAHLEQQAELLKAGKVDRAQWYQHVVQCKKVCNTVVSGLLFEHVRRVQHLPHLLVTFPTGSASLDSRRARRLASFVTAQGEAGTFELLLVGRASRSGNKLYNRELSDRRVSAVRNEVGVRGVPQARVHGFGLGYEPPQITAEIARLYGLDPALPDRERNQSVLVVAYPVEKATGGEAPAPVAGAPAR